MGFTYFIFDMLGGSGVAAPAAPEIPHICQPAGFMLTGEFTALDLSGSHTRFDLATPGITEWAEDC